jgi:CheY-like chemotaxis protein
MSARILIAEDDALQAAALRTVLNCRGYEADSVTDGVEAVRRLRGGSYHLALLDFHMPEISGLATARLLHDLLTPADRPRLIALTAAADELQEIERNAESHSFHAIIAKQSGLQALLEAVDANATPMVHIAPSGQNYLTDRQTVPIFQDITFDPEESASDIIVRYPFRSAAQRPFEIQTISLAAFKLTMGPAWARMSYRVMQRAEQIIRRRLASQDVISRISDHGFAIWFSHGSEMHIETLMAGAVREIRLRLMMDYGDDVPPNPDLLI